MALICGLVGHDPEPGFRTDEHELFVWKQCTRCGKIVWAALTFENDFNFVKAPAGTLYGLPIYEMDVSENGAS